MSHTEDLDSTIDGFDPSELTRGATRKRRRTVDNALDDLEGRPMPYASAPNPERRGQIRNAKADKNAGNPDIEQRAGTPEAPAAALAMEQPKQGNAFVRFFTDDRLRVFLGISMLLLSVFVIIALVSHMRSGAHDQSHVLNSTLSEMAQAPGEIHNAGGGFGAWLSHVLLCDALGLGSIVFVAYSVLLSLALLGLKKVSFWSLTFKTLLLSITISLVLGLVTFDTPSVLKWGGNHGHYINKLLIDYSTIIGAICVSALMVGAVVSIYLHELKSLIKRCRESSRLKRMQEQLRKQKERKLESIAEDPAPAAETQAAEAPKETQGIEFAQNEEQKVQTADTVDLPSALEGGLVFPSSEEEKLFSDNDNSETEQGSSIEFAGFSFGDTPAPAEQKAPIEEPVVAAEPAAEPMAEFAFAIDTPAEQPEEIAEAQAVAPQEVAVETPQQPIAQEEAVAEEAKDDTSFSITAPQIERAEGIDENENPSDNIGSAETPYDHRADLYNFQFPPLGLLEERPQTVVIDEEEQQANKDRIVKTLADYNIAISKIEATVGPTITLYEIVPAEGVRISSIKRLEDDIAMSLSAVGIRIIAPMPGKGTVGIEVPNATPQTVSMHSVITSKQYQECQMALPMALGATISNEIFIADMAKMPHLLVAGATGMGKSVGLNAIITSLIYKKHPSELKFVLVDPKMVEFSLYNKLERHYLAKLEGTDEEDAVITEPSKVIQTLKSLCLEMDNRYALLKDANVRVIEEYNKKFSLRKLNPKNGHRYLPYIVVIVDEFADLITTAGKEVEVPIMRIAQKARAVGIHMIIATQRPATNVITGNIKANFPGRIAFRVIQMVDSKTILDTTGANQLIGRGDMLFSHNGNIQRVQCAFISTEEVEAITDWIDAQVGYSEPYPLPEVPLEGGSGDGAAAGASSERDSMFDEAARYVVLRQVGSTSSLQRQFGIGYNRAAKLMDQFEAAGIVGPLNGARPRAILVDAMELESILNCQ